MFKSFKEYIKNSFKKYQDNENKIQFTVISYAIYSLLILLTFYTYLGLSRLWVSYGGVTLSNHRLWLFEIPLLLAVSWITFSPQKKILHMVTSFISNALAFVVLYAIVDIFYNYQHKTVQFSDINNIINLWYVGMGYFIPTITLTVLPALLWGIAIFYSTKQTSLKKSTLHFTVRFSLLSIFLATIPTFQFSKVAGELSFAHRNDRANLRERGRFASVFYYQRRQNLAYQKIAKLKIDKRSDPLFTGKISIKKNIHMIIMESFIHPANIKGIQCNKEFTYKKLTDMVKSRTVFDIVISPGYGGGTAESEFEFLSGIPAYGEFNSIDFNTFNGKPFDSFVSFLKDNNYETISNVATGPGYYNSLLAYESIGFNSQHYLDNGSYLKSIHSGDLWIFDGDVFQQNLNFIRPHITGKQKFLNYIMGSYGHAPLRRNRKLRPNVLKCTVNNTTSTLANDFSNMYYYRSKALYEFIVQLLRIDPNSIIFVTSDHIPKLSRGKEQVKYKLPYASNIALLLDAGKKVNIAGAHYYEIPYILHSRLTNKRVKIPSSKTLKKKYYENMSNMIKQ